MDYASLGNDDPLPANALDEGALAERFTGCLLGGAVGDALGRPLEGGSPGNEWVEDYRQWHGWTSGPKGTITDDTQFSMWLLQSLIANGGVEPHDLVQRFTAEKIRGIGQATRDFVRNAKVLGKPWFESGGSLGRQRRGDAFGAHRAFLSRKFPRVEARFNPSRGRHAQ